MTEHHVAALYLRSATQNDDAIAEQLRTCTEHAAARGWRVGEIFIDNAMSGVRCDRPGLEALSGCLREGRASVVIAEDAARIFRDLDKLSDFGSFCDGLGVEISWALHAGSTKDLMQQPTSKEVFAALRRRAAGRIPT